MNYDEELEFLRKEFKKSEAKFHEAEREGWHTDSNIYEDNMANLGYQIHIHEQAAKADEYEAKAKAWDKLMAEIDRITEEAAMKGPPPKTTLINKVIAVTMAKKEYEIGESDV